MSDNTKVIRALFDTHLTIRINEGTWGRDFKIEIPADDEELRAKLESVKKIVSEIPTASIQQAPKLWIEFIYKLTALEDVEKAKKEKVRNYPLSIIPIGRVYAKKESMEQNAAHAARAYIVSQLEEYCKQTYKQVKNELSQNKDLLKSEIATISNLSKFDPVYLKSKKEELALVEKKYDALVGAQADKFHETVFFPDVIKKRDVRKDQDNKSLSEDTFDAYCVNAASGQRKTTNLDKLINQPVATPATPAAASSSTSSTSSQPAATVTGTSAAMFQTASAPINIPEPAEMIHKVHNTRSKNKHT